MFSPWGDAVIVPVRMDINLHDIPELLITATVQDQITHERAHCLGPVTAQISTFVSTLKHNRSKKIK